MGPQIIFTDPNRSCQWPATGVFQKHETERLLCNLNSVEYLRDEFMAQRQHLNRNDIDKKVEEVILHFDAQAFVKRESPIYNVVAGLKDIYHVPFHFNQDLGRTTRGKKVFKILGRFDFKPRQILIDKVLPYDSPRFRWTLCHEIGHFVLHRKLDPKLISRDATQFVDTRTELRFIRSARWSELEWVEWQANQFASAMLLPQPIVHVAVATVQRELNIPRPGSIYLDDQPWNVRDYVSVLTLVSKRLNVSRSVLRIRLANLGILTDARRSSRDHIQETLRAFFSEADAPTSTIH